MFWLRHHHSAQHCSIWAETDDHKFPPRLRSCVQNCSFTHSLTILYIVFIITVKGMTDRDFGHYIENFLNILVSVDVLDICATQVGTPSIM